MTAPISAYRPVDRIENILNAVEHIWKLYPSLTFSALVHKVFGDELPETDEQVEQVSREFLHRAFATSRDTT